jgi:hypothetical protein
MEPSTDNQKSVATTEILKEYHDHPVRKNIFIAAELD